MNDRRTPYPAARVTVRLCPAFRCSCTVQEKVLMILYFASPYTGKVTVHAHSAMRCGVSFPVRSFKPLSLTTVITPMSTSYFMLGVVYCL